MWVAFRDHLEVLWGALVALAIVVALTPAVGGMARLLGVVDNPGGRRINRRPIPRLGGLAMFLGFRAVNGQGELFKAGVRIFEYEGGMTHVKALLVDDLWAVLGTTNFDNRSFEHNDEVNVAFRNDGITARVTRDVARDLAKGREIPIDDWQRRALWEKLVGTVAWILERQQ